GPLGRPVPAIVPAAVSPAGRGGTWKNDQRARRRRVLGDHDAALHPTHTAASTPDTSPPTSAPIAPPPDRVGRHHGGPWNGRPDRRTALVDSVTCGCTGDDGRGASRGLTGSVSPASSPLGATLTARPADGALATRMKRRLPTRSLTRPATV